MSDDSNEKAGEEGEQAVVSSQPAVEVVVQSSSSSSTVGGQQSPVSYQLSAVAGQSSLIFVDKLRQVLQNSWVELLEATGGRLAFVLYTICLGSLFFLNAWDFPIYVAVTGLSFFAWLAGRRGNWHRAIEPALIGTAILGLAGVLLYLPFYATFQSQARGMLPNLWNPTRLPQFFVFFGPFLVAIIVLLLVLSSRRHGWRSYIGSTVLLTVFGPVLVMLLALTGVLLSPAGREYVQGILNDPDVQAMLGSPTIAGLVQLSLWRRLLNPWTFIFVGGLLGWALALFVGGWAEWRVGRLEDWKVEDVETKRQADEAAEIPPELPSGLPSLVSSQFSVPVQFALILILVGLLLPLSVEFIYLRDNFGYRMNTIFKFYFQAWVLLALASAFAVYYVSKHLRGTAALAWPVGMFLLVAAGLVYPVLAIPNKADFFQNKPTLNAIAWMAEHRPGDYAAIEWLRANVPENKVILEAPTEKYGAYNYAGRISAMTGLPTLLGWGGHQSQWRGNYDEPGRREPDIDQLYNTSDLRQAQALLDKYDITYVIVGDFERERYAPQGLRKFEQFMDVAFQQDGTTIYQRR